MAPQLYYALKYSGSLGGVRKYLYKKDSTSLEIENRKPYNMDANKCSVQEV